jgi:excisionase family DNA binding protein
MFHVKRQSSMAQERGEMISDEFKDEELLTVEQVGEWLKVDSRYVYRLAGSGALLRVYVGRYVRVPAGAVRAYIKTNTVEPLPARSRARRPGAGRHLRRAV